LLQYLAKQRSTYTWKQTLINTPAICILH
jgi:hypothetical protein